jgi:branched-chain amino acid transport system permease protein
MRLLSLRRDPGFGQPNRVLHHVVALGHPVMLVVLVAIVGPLLGGVAASDVVVLALITVVVVVGLYVFMGNSGILSFGHVSFMALGAYTAALLTMPPTMKHLFYPNFPHGMRAVLDWQLSPVPAALAAGLVAAVFALLAGLPLMRLDGFQAGIATLSLLIVVNVVISNWTAVTNGESTTIGVPPVADPRNAAILAIAVICVAYLYQVSARGLSLRAAREDAHAASSLGIHVKRERWLAFGLSAFLVGLGGAMYAYFVPFSSADFYLDQTFLVIAALVIGGRSSLWGAVLGTIVVATVSEVMRRLEEGVVLLGWNVTVPSGSTEIGLALVMFLMLLRRPDGITAGREATTWRWPRRRSVPTPSADVADDGSTSAVEAT